MKSKQLCLLFIVSNLLLGKVVCVQYSFYHKSCSLKLGIIFIFLLYRKGCIWKLLEHVLQREEDGRSSVKSYEV